MIGSMRRRSQFVRSLAELTGIEVVDMLPCTLQNGEVTLGVGDSTTLVFDVDSFLWPVYLERVGQDGTRYISPIKDLTRSKNIIGLRVQRTQREAILDLVTSDMYRHGFDTGEYRKIVWILCGGVIGDNHTLICDDENFGKFCDRIPRRT